MHARTRSAALLVTAAAATAGTASSASADVLWPWQRAAHTGSLTRAPKPDAPAPIVCVVDTGVDLVPSVANQVIGRRTMLDDPDVGDGSYNGDPASGHGTYVAQVIASTWPHARILSVRIGDAKGALADLYRQAINTCIKEGATVVNLSIGAKTAPSAAEQRGLALIVASAAEDLNVDIVAAAGNNPGPTNWPAAALTATGAPVGAVDNNGSWCWWASGQKDHIPIVGAPGCDMDMTATHSNDQMLMRGSSFAAPQVAAVMAAVQAYAPGLTAAQRREAIRFLPGGMLDGDEVLRRVGRADLITPDPPVPVPVPQGLTPVAPPFPTYVAPTPADEYDVVDDELSQASSPRRKPRLSLRWEGRRLVVRVAYRPAGARLVVKLAGVRKTLRKTDGRVTIPAKLSRPKLRVSARLLSRSGKTLTSRTFKAPRR